MPPMPIPRSSGSGRTIIERSPTATVVPGDDHRVAGVGHRLDERRVDVVPFPKLVAEAEDHQQRVVDRDAETDQHDQELHDDRDVGDVGQRPDERERVQDRRDRDDERQQHRRQRPEHEEQDDQRAKAADQPLQQDARPAARAELGRLLDRLVPGHVDRDPGGEPVFGFGAHLRRTALHIEGIRAGRVDLQKGGVPVARDVHRVAGREVRARQRAGAGLHDPHHRRPHRRALGDIDARRVEHDHVRRPLAHSELLQCSQAPLVRRLSRNGSALIPARRELPRGDAAEQRQYDPDADHRPTMTGDEMSETTEPSAIRSIALRPVGKLGRCQFCMRSRVMTGLLGVGGFDLPEDSRGLGRAGRWRAGVCGCSQPHPSQGWPVAGGSFTHQSGDLPARAATMRRLTLCAQKRQHGEHSPMRVWCWWQPQLLEDARDVLFDRALGDDDACCDRRV